METQKVVLVTGASQGIGKALCLEFASYGYRVVGVARSKIDVSFDYHICDVSNEQEVEALSKKISPDVIICAAGIREMDTCPYNHDVVRKTMEINFFGTMNFVKAFPKTKHFISISSLAAFKPNMSASYSASKAAVAMAFRSLEMKSGSDTHFSTVYLGPVNTAMWEGKKSWIVVEPEKVAKRILRLVEDPRSVTYIPFLSTTLSRLSFLIPDILYAKLSKFLFK